MLADGEQDRPGSSVRGPSGDAALARALVLEAVDCLSQASDLTDDEGYASLCRHVQELTVLAERLAVLPG
jgi:hypothetical protein